MRRYQVLQSGDYETEEGKGQWGLVKDGRYVVALRIPWGEREGEIVMGSFYNPDYLEEEHEGQEPMSKV